MCKKNNLSENYRIHAQPLNEIHGSALQRFLNAQKLDISQRKEELFSNEKMNRIQKWNEIKKNSNFLVQVG